MDLPRPFPALATVKDVHNPAIRLFGNRLIKDQSISEYAIEFLGLIYSTKKIGTEQINTQSPLFELEALQTMKVAALSYKMPLKFNVKLFTFLGKSKIEGRHPVHLRQYEELYDRLFGSIDSSEHEKEHVVSSIEEFLNGFVGAGFNRAWCAQVFYPVSPGLLIRESVWNESVVNESNPESWEDSLKSLSTYYSLSKHNFMARGGEILYLQLCLAMLSDSASIKDRFGKAGLSSDEISPAMLRDSLNSGFKMMYGSYSDSIDALVNYIEALDPETLDHVSGKLSWQNCEWCPLETWPESYLFAVELNRLLKAKIDLIDRLELIMTACAMQVMRTTCAQAARYASLPDPGNHGGHLGYAWIFTSKESNQPQRRAAHRNLEYLQSMIHSALYNPALQENAENSNKKASAFYSEAIEKYGYKMLLSLGKKQGIIIPPTGSGARFTMTDGLLRFLVLALVRPGERCSYEVFLGRLYAHYGIAVESTFLQDAAAWSQLPVTTAIQPGHRSWFAEMLKAAGFLTDLSDSFSIVVNPFD